MIWDFSDFGETDGAGDFGYYLGTLHTSNLVGVMRAYSEWRMST